MPAVNRISEKDNTGAGKRTLTCTKSGKINPQDARLNDSMSKIRHQSQRCWVDSYYNPAQPDSCATRPPQEQHSANYQDTQEKNTAFGSLGIPSSPTFSLRNRSRTQMARASSKPHFLLAMILFTATLPSSSSPCLLSPSSKLDERSKLAEVKPELMSSEKEPGRRE